MFAPSLCQLFLSLVPVYPTSCAGTLVLDFYLKGFSSSLEVIGLDCSFVPSNFAKILSCILSIVIGSLSLSNLSSIIYAMVWYYPGKFNIM